MSESDEPRDIRKMTDPAGGEGIQAELIELVLSDDAAAVSTLKEFLLHRVDQTFLKHSVPRLACLALLQKGPAGVQALVEALPDAPGSIYPTAILEALWYASRGQWPTRIAGIIPPPEARLTRALSPETVRAAGRALEDLIVESTTKETIFDPLMQFLYQQNMFGVEATERSAFRSEILELLTESQIKISRRLIADFESLLARRCPEEVYQSFLKNHPVLLDPLASEVIPKQRLGVELVTDFVVRRLDDKYLLVEIEKPHDPIFTGADDFTAQFSHAFGQVLDFQHWVDAHGEYARHLMPEIWSPSGLLVIGRSSDLTDGQKSKLRRFNINSARVEVRTFDDIAYQAHRLYENIHRRSRESEA